MYPSDTCNSMHSNTWLIKSIGCYWDMVCGGSFSTQNKSLHVLRQLVEWTNHKKSLGKHQRTFSYQPDGAGNYSLSTVGKWAPFGVSTVSLKTHWIFNDTICLPRRNSERLKPFVGAGGGLQGRTGVDMKQNGWRHLQTHLRTRNSERQSKAAERAKRDHLGGYRYWGGALERKKTNKQTMLSWLSNDLATSWVRNWRLVSHLHARTWLRCRSTQGPWNGEARKGHISFLFLNNNYFADWEMEALV